MNNENDPALIGASEVNSISGKTANMSRKFSGLRYRWVVCCLLLFATTINYIDRQILSLLKPILDDELGWTNTEFGAINSAFQAAYAVSLFFFGWFVDRFGAKIGYAVSIMAWSLAAIAHALVGTIGGFLAARVFLGMGEGGNFPAAIKATVQWFPKKERALATSLFNAGANVGAVIAPAFVPAVAVLLGWHWAFILAGLAGLMWLCFWSVLYKSPDKLCQLWRAEQDCITACEAPSTKGRGLLYHDILKVPQAWSFIVAKFMTDPVWWFFLIWLPDFFKKTRGLDIKNSWTLLVSIYAIITVLSILGGWITGYLQDRGWSVTRSRKVGMFTFALCVVPLFFVSSVSNWLAVFLLGLAGAAHQAWSANLYTTVSDMFPEETVGSLTGIGSMAGSIGGMLAPLVVGGVLDHFEHGYQIIFGVFSVTYLIAFGLNHLFAPSFQPIEDGKQWMG